MGKKKRKPPGAAGQRTPATPLVQDGAQAAAAGNHEDEGIPLPRPGPSPCSGVMGTMESSTDADDRAATLVNSDKGVPLALENSVGSATILQCSQTLRRFRGMLIIRSHLLLVTASPHRVIRVSGVCRVWASVLSRKQGRVLPRFRHRRTLRSTGAGSPSHLLSWTKRVPARVTHRRQERGCLI